MQEDVWKRLKPTHQLLKTAFKKREISRRCWRTILMRYVDKAMSGNELMTDAEDCWRRSCFRSATSTILSGGTTRVSVAAKWQQRSRCRFRHDVYYCEFLP